VHRIAWEYRSRAVAGIIRIKTVELTKAIARMEAGYCLIEAVEMTLENPFAHGGRSPAWFAATIGIEGGRASGPRAPWRNSG